MIESLEEAPTGRPLLPTNATEVYMGIYGDMYWERNEAHVTELSWIRRAALRTLVPRWARSIWCEVGCGTGANLYNSDIGVDIRNHPRVDNIADIRRLPFKSDSFDVAFCVGVLMHLQDGEWQKGLAELMRIARFAVIIGEYIAPIEKDRMWNIETGEQCGQHGFPGLLWERPYNVPQGWRVSHRTRNLPGFGSDVTFLVFEPDR